MGLSIFTMSIVASVSLHIKKKKNMKQTKPGKSDFWINGKIKGQKMV
jgi:hypothetical protein